MEDILSVRPETVIQQKVESEEFLQKVSDLCLKIAGLLPEKEKTGDIEELESAVRDEYDYRTLSIDNLKEHLKDSLEVRLCKAETLKIPQDKVSRVTVDPRDIKVAVGPLNNHNKSQVKIFFEKLFAYGENSDYGHSQYKAALACLAEDEILEQFMFMKHKDFSEIAKWLYNVHNRSYTAIELENKLKNFIRESNEPIKATMERFSLVAEQLDQFFPLLQRTHNTENNKINFIFKFVNEPAKTLLEKWRIERLESGFYSPYELVLQKANDLERQNDCIPTEIMELSNLEINAFHRNANKRNPFRNQAHQHEKKKKAHFDRQHDNRHQRIDRHRDFSEIDHYEDSSEIDPIKGQKPQFYRTTKPEQRGKGEIPNSKNQSGFQFQPNLSNSTHDASKQFSSKMQDSRNAGGNRFQKGNQFHYGNNGDFSNRDMQNKSQSDHQHQPQRDSNFRQHENRNRFQGNNHRFNKYDDYNYEYNHNRSQRDWKFKDNTVFQGNRSKYVNRPVQKHFFCLRCGIPSNQEERNNFQGSDHTTAYCTIYKQYNSFNCSFCLSKNIEAKHFPQDCKQR